MPVKVEDESTAAALPESTDSADADKPGKLVDESAGQVASEVPVGQTANHQARTEADGGDGLPRLAPSRSRAGAAEAVEVVTDPLLINVGKGALRPQVGDKIYTERNLPADACGTYWVRFDNGLVEEMSVCRDEH